MRKIQLLILVMFLLFTTGCNRNNNNVNDIEQCVIKLDTEKECDILDLSEIFTQYLHYYMNENDLDFDVNNYNIVVHFKGNMNLYSITLNHKEDPGLTASEYEIAKLLTVHFSEMFQTFEMKETYLLAVHIESAGDYILYNYHKYSTSESLYGNFGYSDKETVLIEVLKAVDTTFDLTKIYNDRTLDKMDILIFGSDTEISLGRDDTIDQSQYYVYDNMSLDNEYLLDIKVFIESRISFIEECENILCE